MITLAIIFDGLFPTCMPCDIHGYTTPFGSFRILRVFTEVGQELISSGPVHREGTIQVKYKGIEFYVPPTLEDSDPKIYTSWDSMVLCHWGKLPIESDTPITGAKDLGKVPEKIDF